MRLLLDTHTFLWFVWNDAKLSETARSLIQDPSNELLVSAGSVWEIGIKVGIGKLSVGQDLEAFFPEQLGRNRISLLPISLEHAAKVARLPFHHNDPFDRLIAAQCLIDELPLVSIDAVFDLYGVRRLWYEIPTSATIDPQAG